MKPALRRRLLKELAFILILGTPVALFFLIAAPRSHAAHLLHELRLVQVNHTPFQQVEAMAGEFGNDAACVGDNCLFQFQNVWLHRLGLAPTTEFTVMVRREGSSSDAGGGRVGSLDMAMLVSRLPDAGAIASALVFDHLEERGLSPYQASITLDDQGKPERTVVRMSPRANAAQRREARAFNLGCLTRVGGCHTSRQLLPTVWQGARRIQSASTAPAPAPILAIWLPKG